MSMCIIITDNNGIIMAGDSRMSTKGHDGTIYDTGMEIDKLRQVKGKMFFGAGTCALYHEMLNQFEKAEGDSMETFQDIVKGLVAEWEGYFRELGVQENEEDQKRLEEFTQLNIAAACVEEGIPTVYYMSHKTGYELRKTVEEGALLILGKDIPIIQNHMEELAEDERYGSLEDIITEVYGRCSGNYAGGTLSIYLIDSKNDITLLRQEKIIDRMEVLRAPEEYIAAVNKHMERFKGLTQHIRFGIGILADIGLTGLNKVGRLVVDNVIAGKFDKIPIEAAATMDNTAKSLKPTLIKSTGTYKVKNTALDNAINEYNTAIETIQNHFKTNQLREEEMVRIKSELGIDLNSIIKNIETAEKGIDLKRIGAQRNLANAAGVKELPKITQPISKKDAPKPLINEFKPLGSIATPKVEKPLIKLPTVEGKATRSLPSSILNSEVANPELKASLSKTDYSYDPITNQGTLENVRKIINSNYDEAIRRVKDGPVTAENNALGMELVRKLQGENRYNEAIDIIEDISKKATESGQAIQALSMWGRLTPEGMLKYTQKLFDKANDQMFKDGDKLTKRLKLSEDFAKNITERMNKVNAMPDSREKTIEIAKVLRDIDEQLPKTIWRKVSTIQTLAQLLNPKTMIRNTVGNAIFGGLENISNVLGTPLDTAVSRITGQRTTILPSVKTQIEEGSKGFVEAVEDALQGIDTKGMGTKFELGTGNTFKKGTLLGKLETGLNVGLKATDSAFSEAARAESLRQQMIISGATEPTPGMIEIADRIAKYRTFQDSNGLSEGFKRIKDGLNKLSSFFTGSSEWGLGDLVLKYSKTPANILARGIDYSPVSAIKAINEATKPLRGKVFNQKEFVDALSRGTTGTGLILLGYQLNRMGLITGAADKDMDVANLKRDIGQGEYRLNTTALNRFIGSGNPEDAKAKNGDTFVSWDWAAPTSIMLGVGANVAQNRGNTADLLTTLMDASVSGLSTLVEQPLLTGVKKLTGGYDPVKNIANTLQGTPASFTPTLGNQLRQLSDNTARSTYNPSFGKEAVNMVKGRLPVSSKGLQPRITTLGKEKEVYPGGSNNLLNVLLNPANVSKNNPTPAAEMVLDIYEKSGEKIQFPRTASTYIMHQGKRIDLTPEQVTELQKYLGEETAKRFDKLALSPAFRNQKPELQAKKLQGILTEINQEAKKNLLLPKILR